MKESFNSAFRVHFHFYYLFHFFSRGGKVLFFALALLAAWPAAVSAAGPEGCSEQGVPPATASAPTEGLKAYVDPETGELISEPPPGETEAPESVSMAQAEP
ncbi:MAG TPA: hypothetical protein VJN01_12705, partial [Xanthomonadales bacterium]|nr:hypothetical protein [Xanthomonadales bacterium]